MWYGDVDGEGGRLGSRRERLAWVVRLGSTLFFGVNIRGGRGGCFRLGG